MGEVIQVDDAPALIGLLREGRKLKPIGWTDETIFRDAYCCVRDSHTFVQHTPHTIGVETSPAIAGAADAIRQFGNQWVDVDTALAGPAGVAMLP